MELLYRDRVVADVERLLRDWREKERDWGQLYLEHKPATPKDRMLVEDLGVTMLVNSRVDGYSARGVARNAGSLDLGSLPAKPLEETTADEREVVARMITAVATWEGFGASRATKALHKKRPALIPLLDNRAIFEAYMHPLWPARHTYGETVRAEPRIREALESITTDLTRPQNGGSWHELERAESERTRVELFDMVWWMHFREVEPV